MKKLLMTTIMLFSMTFSMIALGQEAELSSIDKFMVKYYWIIGGLILLWEYLVGISKFKSNSTIDMFLNFIKALKPKK